MAFKPHRLGAGADTIRLARKLKDRQHTVILHAYVQRREEWGEDSFSSFNSIASEVELPRKWVRKVTRHLKRLGLTEYSNGLWNDTGPAGAGYRATQLGCAVMRLKQAFDEDTELQG